MEGKKKNNAKFGDHYVRPRMQNVRVHALRLHQNCKHLQMVAPWCLVSLCEWVQISSGYSPVIFILYFFHSILIFHNIPLLTCHRNVYEEYIGK